MRTIRALCLRIADAFIRVRREREFADEMASHLQLHIDDNLRAGMTPTEARRVAMMSLGGVAQTTERYRDRRGLPILDALRQDVVYAVRVLRKNRGFTATVVVTLALGIGANTAIFSVVNAVLLRPLPYPDAHRLVSVGQLHLRSGTPEWATWPDYMDWRDHAIHLQSLGSAWPVAINLTGDDEPERLPGAAVTANLFSVLQVAPIIGRIFSEGSDQDPRSVILGEGLWRRRFASDPRMIGRRLELNGRSHTVVGVIYGVLSFTVAQQTREIGIRMALGAASRDVLRLAVRQGMAPVLAGLLVGVVVSFAATRALKDMLFEIRPHDVITLATVAGLLLTVSLLATLIPARRAARVDPLSALRHE